MVIRKAAAEGGTPSVTDWADMCCSDVRPHLRPPQPNSDSLGCSLAVEEAVVATVVVFAVAAAGSVEVLVEIAAVEA